LKFREFLMYTFLGAGTGANGPSEEDINAVEDCGLSQVRKPPLIFFFSFQSSL
jgi:hypothetical protein